MIIPDNARHASTHDGDPRNDGSTHALQMQHTVHANVTPGDTIGDSLADADIEENRLSDR
jgi:hypothetical protein